MVEIALYDNVVLLSINHDNHQLFSHKCQLNSCSYFYIQEMYMHIGPQFYDELQRYYLPPSMVII